MKDVLLSFYGILSHKRKLTKQMMIVRLAMLLTVIFAFNLTVTASAANTANVAAQSAITGTVTDETTGEALPGVNVVVQGTTRGVITDANGQYSIQASPEEVLVFSYIGYIGKTAPVGNETEVNVTLSVDIQSLDEIVVVGYGTQKRVEVTGAIASVGSDELTAVPVGTADQALQGRAAGVTVINNGSPGTAPTIRIRGISTASSNDPLIVIDGVVAAGLGDINPSDIESIQVLKDASTAAIYGSQGSNGVIMVTTKKGASGQVTVSLDAYTGTQWTTKRFDLLNAEQYIQYASSADIAGTPPVISDPQYADRLTGADTDWQDEIFQSGKLQNYNLAVAGGGENSVYRISGGYVQQDGILINTGYERYNFRANSDFTRGKLKIGENIAVAFSDQKPETANGGRSILEHAIKSAPYLPVYNPDNLGGFQGPNTAVDGQDAENPVRIMKLNTLHNVTTSIIGNVYGEFEIIDGLKFKSVAGLEDIGLQMNQFYPMYNDDNLGGTHSAASATIVKNKSTYRSLIYTNSLNYTKTLADVHNVEVLLLSEYSTIDKTQTALQSQNTITSAIDQLGNTAQNISSTLFEYKRIGYLGRLNYNYNQKYLFAASIRKDASSRFGKNNRWGTFPSVAAGWRINKESFMSDVTILSNLKLRGSWGKAGNDKIVDYQYSSTLTSNMNYVIAGAAVPGTTMGNLENPDLKWEEITMTNLGLDIGLLNNQITAAVEYYINKSDDLLIPVPTINSFGVFTASVPRNVGSVETKGFEFQLGYNDFEGEFQWSANLNLGTVKNEVTSLGGPPISGFNFENENLSRCDVDEPLFYFYGWEFDGLFQTPGDVTSYMGGSMSGSPFNAQPGDFRIVDTDGDGVITSGDRTNIGNPFPDLTASINLSADYKGLDLSVFINGVYGNDIYNTNLYDLEGMPRLFNAGTKVLERWTGPNTSNSVPRGTTSSVNHNVQASSRFVEDGSYTRVRNITLGYTLPASIFKGVISKCRIYVSAQNLVTITDYSGLDPEIGAYTITASNTGARSIGSAAVNGNGQPLNNFANGIDVGTYPIPKSVIGGIQISF